MSRNQRIFLLSTLLVIRHRVAREDRHHEEGRGIGENSPCPQRLGRGSRAVTVGSCAGCACIAAAAAPRRLNSRLSR